MFDPDFLVPFLVLSVPIIAIVGGIVAGIVRSAGQQRMLELAQRERIAAIERGIDPDKLPPFPQIAQELGSLGRSPADMARHRAQGLVIGGLVTLFGGIGLLVFLILMQPNDKVWGVGLMPIMVGAALLLSSWIVWPRNGATKH
jgi:hypothetical protein